MTLTQEDDNEAILTSFYDNKLKNSDLSGRSVFFN